MCMNIRKIIAALTLPVLICGCASKFEVAGVQKERILIDNRYDVVVDKSVSDLLAPYRSKVDSMMSPVVGKLAKNIKAYRPESELSNLLADILVWAGKRYGEDPLLGVYNMGGMRASLTAGDVTYGNILEVAPFENKICFLTLKGEHLLMLFREMAEVGGEGVSSGVRLVITSDGKLKSVKLHGKDIDPMGDYRIATIDYLAEGNDGLGAFKLKKHVNAPREKSNNSRFVITSYFQEMMKQGRVVDANVEGRITLEEK